MKLNVTIPSVVHLTDEDFLDFVQAERDRRFRWAALVSSWVLVAAIAAITMLGCARPAPTLPAAPRARLEQERASVLLEVTCVYGDSFRGRFINAGHSGSSVAIAPRVGLTAGHVLSCEPMVEDGRELPATIIVRAVTPDGRRHVARVDQVDVVRDLGRYRTDDDLGAYAAPALAAPVEGEPICTAPAFPERGGHNCGAVYRVSPRPDPDGDVAHWALSDFGNSGAGAYDLRGRLVAIVVTLHWCGGGPHIPGATCGGGASTVPASMVRP